MKFLFNLFLLYKAAPTLLAFFGISKMVKETDVDGNDWTGPAGEAPGATVVHPTNEEAMVAGLGAAFAAYDLLAG